MEAAEAQELDFAAVTSRCTKGLAQIDLAALDFDFSLQQGHRQPSDKIVSALEKKFKLAGCHRRDPQNYISALIDEDALRTAPTAAGSEEAALAPRDDNPTIPYLPVERVDCLHGLHRVLAARRHLPEDDRWWIVRLYSSRETLPTSPHSI